MANGAAKPELSRTTNPIGILRLETPGGRCEQPRFRGFLEHKSSIPDWERGLGLNYMGVEIRYN